MLDAEASKTIKMFHTAAGPVHSNRSFTSRLRVRNDSPIFSNTDLVLPLSESCRLPSPQRRWCVGQSRYCADEFSFSSPACQVSTHSLLSIWYGTILLCTICSSFLRNVVQICLAVVWSSLGCFQAEFLRIIIYMGTKLTPKLERQFLLQTVECKIKR